ncbi:MAG: hypothetical protein QM619_16235 [Micropruina sp.]|uniref:GAF domain-containing protein n=1 Tax=Micropruina sp. TaxID=2737536 RepID=UPI0039E46389
MPPRSSKQSDETDDDRGWVATNLRYLIALALSLGGLIWLLWVPRICGQELGGAAKDTPVEVCRAVQLTDPVVLAWLLGVVLVLWGTLSEASVAGVITLKRAVTEAKRVTEEARATLLRVDASARQSQTQILQAGGPVGPGQFGTQFHLTGAVPMSARPHVISDGQLPEPNPADASLPQEEVDRAYVDLVDWVVRSQLDELTSRIPGADAAHAYVQDSNGLLSRIDGPVGKRGRSWKPGEGTVGTAWLTGAFVSGEPAGMPITAVAAVPIMNAAGRSIGVLSIHSTTTPPPDFDSDDVLFAMSASSERMARVYVALLRIETDA